MLGRQRLRIIQTGAANGDSRDFAKRFAADAAIVGENQLKKAAERLFRGVSNTVGQTRQATTGEQAA